MLEKRGAASRIQRASEQEERESRAGCRKRRKRGAESAPDQLRAAAAVGKATCRQQFRSGPCRRVAEDEESPRRGELMRPRPAHLARCDCRDSQ